MRWSQLVAISSVALACALAGCPKAGGAYAPVDRDASGADRGETAGRMFDFVSNRPEGDDWQIRIRGSSMWVSYASDADVEDLGTKNLSRKETRQVWQLIDQLDIAGRKKGKKDDVDGYVQLRLREPGGEDGHDIFQIYVSRATEDDDVLELADYLIELISRYHPKYKDDPAQF